MIDLHIHSNYSDGTYSVSDILKEAEKRKLEIISITDHDSVKAYHEIYNNKSIRNIYEGKIIIGSEIKCYLPEYNLPVEILGYGIDISEIENYLQNNQIMKIQNKYLEYLKKVGKGIGLIFDEDIKIDNEKHAYASDIFQRELIKHLENEEILKKNNISLEPNFYRAEQCNKNSIFYINEKEDFIKIGDIIEKIHDAGGLAFLAHPYIYPTNQTEEMVELIIEKYELDGVECYYSAFTQEQTKRIIEICNKHNKFISGGTDFHGDNRPNTKMGEGKGNLNIKKEIIENWINKISII